MLRTVIFILLAIALIFLAWQYTPAIFQEDTPLPESKEEDITNSQEDTEVEGTSVQTQTMEGLIIEDTKVGEGQTALAGQTVTVHYVGTLENGTKFDSSRDRGQPFSFNLGGGQVIQGWDQGLVGMKVGGLRKLTIAPEMGYGARAAGSIPPNSTLIFEVELLSVQ